jgi:hypothetical protein
MLWRRRQREGMRQTDIVVTIGRDAGWVSRNLRAPGNWTLRTIGELAEALNGEVEIVLHAKEDPPENPANYSAYAGYEFSVGRHAVAALQTASQVIGQQIGGRAFGQVIG